MFRKKTPSLKIATARVVITIILDLLSARLKINLILQALLLATIIGRFI
jgi:hypothetical protein